MNSNVDNLLDQAFAWFTGVIEDIQDPKQMGRVRVRCIGYHSDNKTDIPTESLPWATVVMPVTSAAMSGIGQSATGVLPGSWVVGFFRDGRSAQDPIVLGTIPTSSTRPDYSKGFSDPSQKYPLRDGEVDIPVEARDTYEESESYQRRVQLRNIFARSASAPQIVGDPIEPTTETRYWASPSPIDDVAPEYPKNHVIRTESGHVREMDDTPGKERTLDYHRSGTHTEINSKGTRTTTIVGDNFTICLEDNYIYVKGDFNISVQGNMSTYVKGNYILEVAGDKVENVHGARYTKVDNLDLTDVKQSILAVDTSGAIALKSELDGLEGRGGIEFIHPDVFANGNLRVATGANGTMTSVDGSTLTITDGIVTTFERT